jgi:hypothetical protein
VKSLAIVAWLGATAVAQPTSPASPTAGQATPTAASEPAADDLARHAAEEANLVSIAPRVGLTFAIAVGGAMLLGGDGGVGRGGALSLRVGQVATPNTIITFELTGGSALHDTQGMLLHNDDGNVLAGGQYYAAPVFWVRGAGGFGVYTKHSVLGASTMTATYSGPAGAVGAGLDLYRRHYLAIGLEAFAIAKIARDGLHTTSGLCLGVSYY